MNKVLVIVGPTAIGKSSLAIELAKKYNGEIINGDSVSVYKELDIGSAKTIESEREGIIHHLIDYIDVKCNYSVANFQKDARKVIEDICKKGKLPIVVGGTGLYIKALLYDYNFAEEESCDHDDEKYKDASTEDLYSKLKEVDLESTKVIHQNNRKRIIRALKIAESGVSKSTMESQQNHEMIYDAKIIGLTIERSKLIERINLRVDKMIEDGLTKEVEDLFTKYGYGFHCFSAIGYKEYIGLYEGNQNLEDTINLIKVHTRQFAKRQYTWFKNQMNVDWYDIEKEDFKEDIDIDVEKFLK